MSPIPTATKPASTYRAPSALAKTGWQRNPTWNAPHLVIVSRAGTGKTTTLVEGLKYLKGLPTLITPSEQQRAIWDELCRSKGSDRFILFSAFNVSIANELKKRIPCGHDGKAIADASTIHSQGFRCIRKAYGHLVQLYGDDFVSEDRTQNLILGRLGMEKESAFKEFPGFIPQMKKLVSLSKANLLTGTEEQINWLMDRYDISFGDTDGGMADTSKIMRMESMAFELVPALLEDSRDPNKDGRIDYDDMIWLPIVNNIPVAFRFGIFIGDEAQDFNPCQQELATRLGERLILCGDDKQAIYGFAGADSESLPRMTERLKATPRNCVVLPLNVTRRCGKAIVAEACRYVPDFRAHESNPAGTVTQMRYPGARKEGNVTVIVKDEDSYLTKVQPGDMCVSRANAPLAKQCMKLLKRGTRAYIKGRKEAAQEIVSLITKLKAKTVKSLITKLGEWFEVESTKELARKNPRESKIELLADKRDTALAFTEDSKTVKDVIKRIEDIFTEQTEAVVLSSVHRAKGLESKRVFILAPGGFRGRHPKTQNWEWEQELNLRYVAITRAIEELVYVH